MSRQALFIGTLILVALSAVNANAQLQIFWQGGAGSLTDANYTDGTNTNLSPQATDYVFLGDTGTVSYNGSGVGLGRLRIGHNQATEPGTATLTVTDGALVQLNSGAAGVGNAGIQVGSGQNGVLNIDNGATVEVNRLVVVGAGNNVNRTGTLNIMNDSFLNVIDGNLNVADGINQQNGVQGIVNLSGAGSSITISGPGADLVVGPRAATGTYSQVDGTVTVNDAIEVGTPAGSSTGTTFSISGGTLTTGIGTGANAGNFFVGRGATVNATVNISGTATVNVGNRYLMGGSITDTTPPAGFATGVTTNHSGGTLNVDVDIRVADAFESDTSDATYNLSGTGVLNTNVLAATTGSSVIGRQGVGRFIQTGGTANFNSPLVVGSREAATAQLANGLYRISAGNLNVNAATPTFAQALSIAPNGTGEFRVVGDDATIGVIGDFAISSTANGNGTLAFELEAGDLLSQINIVGAATFNAGSILRFDTTNASPTQTSYDVLTATSILDSGITFSGPGGWGYEIVAGGNGQILRIADGLGPNLTGDHNSDGVVDAADYVVWRKLGTNGAQGYTDFRTQFGQSASGGGSGGQVPEPAAAVLVLMATLAVAGCRRRVVVG